MLTLVVGATGALGRPLVRLLRERGLPVRAACRHPQAAADLAALGAEVVAVDLVDAASLAHAFAGAEVVVMAAHAILGRGRWRSEAVDDAGARCLVDTARRAGVRRLVYCSAFGAREGHPVDFLSTKARVERHLRSSGLSEWVILRPTAFMQQHVHQFNGQVLLERGQARLIGLAAKPRNFVCADDVARIAVRAVVDPALAGQVVCIGGHDHLSNQQVAELYARESGLPLRISRLPTGLAGTLATLLRPLHPGLARILRMQALPDDALDERYTQADELEQRFGLQLKRLPAFVAERVADWRARPR